MNFKKKYLLRQCDEFGNTTNLEEKPGQPIKPFDRKKDAVAWAIEHPEAIQTGFFKAEEILELVPASDEDNEAGESADE